jgi:hypothetical protein
MFKDKLSNQFLFISFEENGGKHFEIWGSCGGDYEDYCLVGRGKVFWQKFTYNSDVRATSACRVEEYIATILVTIDGLLIDDRMYLTLWYTAFDCTLQVTVNHTH